MKTSLYLVYGQGFVGKGKFFRGCGAESKLFFNMSCSFRGVALRLKRVTGWLVGGWGSLVRVLLLVLALLWVSDCVVSKTFERSFGFVQSFFLVALLTILSISGKKCTV